MALPKFVPTLSSEGWIKYSSRGKLDQLLADFFTADGAQSSLYYGALASFRTIHSGNILDVTRMREEIEVYLNAYLAPFFNRITVEVEYCNLDGQIISHEEMTGLTRVGFFLKCTYEDNEEIQQLDKPVLYENNVFKYTLDKFNNGIM